MDMQGQPVGGNKGGTKVTSDREAYQDPVKEGAGAVASDSLAAESARSGGAFGENRDSNPLSVPGNKSTFANTDTSAASTLSPARDASTRDDGSSGSSGGVSSGSKGDSYDTSTSRGAFSDGGAGGSSADMISSSDSGSGTGTAASGGRGGASDSDVPVAPSYVSDVTQTFGQGKPKGSNITEGSAEDFKGPSDQDAEIGSENDPGRKAESDFQKRTQQSSGSTAPKQGMQSGDQPYSSLNTEQEL